MSKAKQFKALHKQANPLILFNIWDAGTAKMAQSAGAKAIATGSHSVAAAHGFEDGENIPLDLVLDNLRRIVSAVDLPVSCDIESGYGEDATMVHDTVAQVVETGAVGINLEDQIIGGHGLYDMATQAGRILAARKAADRSDKNFFINARTDLFLKVKPKDHADILQQAINRAIACATAGANGFFAPGLTDETLIRQLCDNCPLAVNILAIPEGPTAATLANLGVSRVSHGPWPYRNMAVWFTEQARAALNDC
ncbi:MAG: phosphonomutase [Rhodobacterales bacterium]|nr:MAG: phosphonomutase [Rhodobacterales bacterium]